MPLRPLAGVSKSQIRVASSTASLLTVALSLLLSSPHACNAEEAAINLDEAVNKIRQAKIINPQCSVKLAITGREEATVVIQRDPKASDEDCKIDAVLVTRTLMDKYPAQLVRVKSVFVKSPGECGEATVTAGDIRSFSNGAIDKKSLLESIELVRLGPLEAIRIVSKTEPATSSGVVAGPLQPWRLLTLEHINKLSAVGVNVKVFLDEFGQIEELAATSQQKEMRRRLLRLNDELREQEKMTLQAKQLRSGPFGNRKRPMAAISVKVQEMANQGKDVTPYTAKIKEIERLRLDGRAQEAKRLVDELSRSLGL